MSASLAMSDSLEWVCGDAWFMDTKSFGGYVRLVGYIRRAGSAPTDDRDLATILGVTVGYLRKRTWPLIRHLFVEHGDGRMTHPRVQQTAPGPKGVAPALSQMRRENGRKGGLARAESAANGLAKNLEILGNGVVDKLATELANPQANPQANPSKNVANSTPVASDFASNLPEFASDLAPTPSLSLASSASSQPSDLSIESEEGSQREGEGAGASLQANPQANSQAKTQANPQANPGPRLLNGQAKIPLRDDWQPTAGAVEAMTAMGHDPAHVARKYRLWCKDNDKRSNDHDAAFELFYLKEGRHEPAQQRSVALTRSIPGGKPDKGAFMDQEIERMRAKHAARNGDDSNDGPIIEGMVG